MVPPEVLGIFVFCGIIVASLVAGVGVLLKCSLGRITGAILASFLALATVTTALIMLPVVIELSEGPLNKLIDRLNEFR